jgi:hypothetical protein
MTDARQFFIGGMKDVPKISRFMDVGRSVDVNTGNKYRTKTTNGHNRYGSMRQPKRIDKHSYQIDE